MLHEIDYDELLEPVRFSFALDRRSFVQMLGAGVLVTAIGTPALAQRRGAAGAVAAVFAVGRRRRCRRGFISRDDGTITVLSGKVDGGQGCARRVGAGGGRRAARAARQDPGGAGRYEPCAERRQHGRQRHDAAHGAGRAAGGGRDSRIVRRARGREVERRAGSR